MVEFVVAVEIVYADGCLHEAKRKARQILRDLGSIGHRPGAFGIDIKSAKLVRRRPPSTRSLENQ